MKNGTKIIKTFQVYEKAPSGKTRGDKVYKTFARAYQRLLALQESNNNEAMYCNGVVKDYYIVSNTKKVIC